MNLKTIIKTAFLACLVAVSFSAAADNVTVNTARAIANGFIKSHAKATPGSLMAPATADILLAHAEPSSKVANANVYYIFNIKGGGFVIVSGDDNAAPVLGYSDKGQIDVNHLSEGLSALLEGYKCDIEYLQTHKIATSQSVQSTMMTATSIVEPMLKTTWGPEDPYNYQCPTLNGKYSKVGCGGVCMAQAIKFWEYPTSMDSLPSYYGGYLGATVPALPPTTFDFSKMIPSYSHWNFATKSIVFETYTEEQMQEVAKLCRYCGQSIKMNYSPSLSMTTYGKLPAMKSFGYNSKAVNYNRTSFSDETWRQMMHKELDEGRPIMYAAYGSSSVGHAFLVDGYDSEEYYHMNMGWFGYNDGWYLITAIIFVNRYGENRNYYTKHSMIVGLEPPLFCTINTEVTADGELFLLGDTFTPQAVDVNLSMSYRTLPFMFSLTDAQGNEVALSESITLNRLTFENGSDISLALALPENLPEGTYDLHLNYRTGDSEPLTQAVTAEGQLYVVGKFAKFGAPFGISDVIDAVDILLVDNSGRIGVDDLTSLIDFLLDE